MKCSLPHYKGERARKVQSKRDFFRFIYLRWSYFPTMRFLIIFGLSTRDAFFVFVGEAAAQGWIEEPSIAHG